MVTVDMTVGNVNSHMTCNWVWNYSDHHCVPPKKKKHVMCKVILLFAIGSSVYLNIGND